MASFSTGMVGPDTIFGRKGLPKIILTVPPRTRRNDAQDSCRRRQCDFETPLDTPETKVA
jgi:hypothetical protein